MLVIVPAVVLMRMPVTMVIVGLFVMMIADMAVRMLPVGAGLRIERRFHGRDLRAEPAQHIFNHMVPANAQPIADNLHVDMAVADVPGEPRQLVTVRCGDFDQRFGPADDAHNAAIVEHEAVAVAQSGRLRQVKQKGRAPLAGQDNAAAVPVVRIELNVIDRTGAVPVARRLDAARPFHIAHQSVPRIQPTQF